MALLSPQPKKQLQDGKLIKLPGTMSLQEAKDQTSQVIEPTSPMLASNLGASPMAAAMAGGPAQQKRIRTDATADAATVEKKDVAKLETGGGSVDDLVAQLSNDISTLGSIENQIPAKALKYINGGMTAGAGTVNKLEISPDSPIAKHPALQDALLKGQKVFMTIGADGKETYTTEQASVDKSYTQLPTTATTAIAQEGISNEDVLGSFDPNTTIPNFIAKEMPDDVKMKWMDFSPEETAAMGRMGVDGELGQKGLQDVARKVEAKFADISKAQAIMDNVISSAEQKAEAQRYLRSQGLAGRYTAAEKANNLVKQMTSDDTVMFNGEEHTIPEILSDEVLQRTANDLLSDPAAMKKALADPTVKGFAEYVQRNSVMWEKLLEPIRASLADTDKVREANKQQYTAGDGTTIDPKLMDEMMPGWKDLRRTGTVQPPPILQVLQTAQDPAEVSKLLLGALSMKDQYPQKWQELIRMDVKTLDQLGLLDGDPSWQELVASENARQDLVKKVGATPLETTKNFLGERNAPRISKQVVDIYAAARKVGIDVLNSGDSKYVASLPVELQPIADLLAEVSVKFGPTGLLSTSYVNKLTNAGDNAFWKGGQPDTKLDITAIKDMLLSAKNAVDTVTMAKQAEVDKAQAVKDIAAKEEQLKKDKIYSDALPVAMPFKEMLTKLGFPAEEESLKKAIQDNPAVLPYLKELLKRQDIQDDVRNIADWSSHGYDGFPGVQEVIEGKRKALKDTIRANLEQFGVTFTEE